MHVFHGLSPVSAVWARVVKIRSNTAQDAVRCPLTPDWRAIDVVLCPLLASKAKLSSHFRFAHHFRILSIHHFCPPEGKLWFVLSYRFPFVLVSCEHRTFTYNSHGAAPFFQLFCIYFPSGHWPCRKSQTRHHFLIHASQFLLFPKSGRADEVETAGVIRPLGTAERE
jgi:hypothetical protein